MGDAIAVRYPRMSDASETRAELTIVGAGAAGLYVALCAAAAGAGVALISATTLARTASYSGTGPPRRGEAALRPVARCLRQRRCRDQRDAGARRGGAEGDIQPGRPGPDDGELGPGLGGV